MVVVGIVFVEYCVDEDLFFEYVVVVDVFYVEFVDDGVVDIVIDVVVDVGFFDDVVVVYV